MAQERAAVEIRGGAPRGSPLLMDRYAGEKPTTIKVRNKTQEWLDARRKAMWMESLYHDGVGLHIPSENVERMLVDGARRHRQGELFKEAVYVEGVTNRLLLYGSDSLQDTGKEALGPPEKWWTPIHIDLRGVVNHAGKQAIRLDCCRPIFRQWGLRFTVVYDTMLVPREEVLSAMERGSLGTYRPRFGRFIVTSFAPLGGNGGEQ